MKPPSEFTNEEHIEHLEEGVMALWLTSMFTGRNNNELIDKMLIMLEERKALRVNV